MSKVVCWFCDRLTDIEDTDYKDHRCPHCGIGISIYDPNIPQLEVGPKTTHDEWIEREAKQKEEEVINYGDEKYQGKFVYLPVMGETATFEIAEISEVKSDNPKFNFSENVPVLINGEQAVDDDNELVFKKKDLGYHIEAKLKNGKVLSITSMSAFIQVFKKHNIQDGEHIKVEHPEKGVWKVTKL